MLFRCHFLGFLMLSIRRILEQLYNATVLWEVSLWFLCWDPHRCFLVAWWAWLFKKKIILFFFYVEIFQTHTLIKKKTKIASCIPSSLTAINILLCPLSLSIYTYFYFVKLPGLMGQSVSLNLILCKVSLEAEPVSLGWSKDCKVIT